jgi:hypothetical protein
LIGSNFSFKNPIRKLESKIITSIIDERIRSKTNFLKKVDLCSKNEKLKNKIIDIV